MPTILFYLFAILMIAGGVCVVALKNPVSSAMGMIGSFIGLAALLIGLNAYFVGTLQVLVYAGAIMVLFIFIIMLLDLKKEERKEFTGSSIAAGVIIPLLFVLVIIPVFQSVNQDFEKLDKKALVAAEVNLPTSEVPEKSIIREKLKTGQLADVNLIGQKLFTDYNFPLQVVGVLLLVATVGCVTLSKKLHGDEPETDVDHRMAKTLAKSSTIPEVSFPATGSEITESSEPELTSNAQDAPAAITVPENAKNNEKLGIIYDSRPDYADDLVIINGVGPLLEDKLNNFGVFTFKQIADWTPENVTEFDDLLSFKGRIDRDNWIAQATELHANKSN
ncbi:MAG: NADH-quinone oxidoreductase subunit J [Akkermansiaceae bacterium]